MSRACICMLCLFASLQTIIAQTGPGGVGSTDGSSNLDIWFDANQQAFIDAGTTLATDGQAVQSWHDISGFSTTGNASNTVDLPLFIESALNGYPALRFDGLNDLLDFTYTTVGTGSLFLIASGSNPTNVQRRAVRLGGTSSSFRVTMGMTTASNFRTRLFNGSTVTALNTTVSASTPYLFSYNYSNGTAVELFVNGNSAASNNTVVTGTPGASGTSRISASSLWNGDIAEIIHVSSSTNEAQKIIIENYLAAKYGLSLTANDIYDEDNDGYDHDVAGIGQAADGSNHTDSQGTGMVRINGADNLEDGEFLFWGHDGEDAVATETEDVPSGVQARFERVWRVSEENTTGVSVDVGSINIIFDLSAFTSVTASDLRLLIDTDNDGTFADETPISGATDEGDSMYQFAGVSSITDNTRFTIASADTDQTPLPIVLVSFAATPTTNESVELKWITASETDNSHFSIERSSNGSTFERIAFVDGAGTTEETQHYQFTDASPLSGTSYYRLKQIDFNGKFTYSEIERVRLPSAHFNILVYPNPVHSGDQVKIKLQAVQNNTHFTLSLINSRGELKSESQIHTNSSSEIAELELRNLSPGIYTLLIQEKSGQQVSKRIIVR